MDKTSIDQEPTHSEILGAINDFTTKTEGRFEKIEKTMATKENLGNLETRLLNGVDEKLSNLKGDLVVLMRKEDKKVVSLIEMLWHKSVLTEKEAETLLSNEPFLQPWLLAQQSQ